MRRLRGSSSTIEELLGALVDETRANRVLLQQFIRRAAANVEGLIYEHYQDPTPPAAGGAVTSQGWQAQTANLEIITGLWVVLPLGTTAATLQIGGKVYQLQNTTMYLPNMQIKTADPTRILAYTAPAAATFGGMAALWGYAAPANNAPGRLH